MLQLLPEGRQRVGRHLDWMDRRGVWLRSRKGISQERISIIITVLLNQPGQLGVYCRVLVVCAQNWRATCWRSSAGNQRSQSTRQDADRRRSSTTERRRHGHRQDHETSHQPDTSRSVARNCCVARQSSD